MPRISWVNRCWIPHLGIRSESSPRLASPEPTLVLIENKELHLCFHSFMSKSLIHFQATVVISVNPGPSLFFPDGYPLAPIAAVKRAIVRSQM